MNFIIELFKFKYVTTETLYNLIMVIVNKLTNYVYFISFKKDFDVQY